MRVLFAVLLASCATTKPRSPAADPRASITRALADQYAAIEKLDIAAWHAHHAADVLWMGDEPIDVYTRRGEVVAALEKFFAPIRQAGGTVKTRAGSPHLGVAPDGRAAWVADEVALEITVSGKTQTAPFRHTAVWSEKDGQWWVVAEFWSLPVPNATAQELASAGKLPAPQKIDQAVGAGAQPVVAAVDQFLNQPAGIIDQIANREDVFLFGSDPTEKIEGITTARKEFSQINGDVKLRRMDGIHAALVGGGHVGFAAFNLEVATPNGAQPYRTLQVWIDEAGTWKLVQHHNANVLSMGAGAE